MIKIYKYKDEVIYKKDYNNSFIYIVKSGSLEVANNTTKQIYIVKENECVGENLFFKNINNDLTKNNYNMFENDITVKVNSKECLCFLLPIQALKDNIGENYKDFIMKNLLKKAFLKFSFLRILINDDIIKHIMLNTKTIYINDSENKLIYNYKDDFFKYPFYVLVDGEIYAVIKIIIFVLIILIIYLTGK